MNRGNFLLLIAVLFAINVSAQYRSRANSNLDIISVGVGMGFDHGGIGANALFFPQENLGFFIGAGYAVAGPALNGGIKYRLTNFSPMYHPFLTVMYGHNALVTTSNAYDKLFYGASLGFGVDIHKQWAYNYFSIAILAPIQGAEMKKYLDTNRHGVSFNSASMLVSLSVSHRFGIK